MEISNIDTNFSGMLPDIRIATLSEWSEKYFKPVKALLGTLRIQESRAAIGEWTAQLKTNDSHIHKYFSTNFHSANPEAKPGLFFYALTRVKDEEFLKAFHEVRNPAKFIEETSKILSSRAYKEGLSDPELLQFDKLPEHKKMATALQKPSGIFVPELNLFLLLNTNSYQVFRDQGVFGSLRRFVLSKIETDENGQVKNMSQAWVPLNAAVIDASGEENTDGIALLSPESAFKAPLSVALVDEIPDSKFIASELVYINPLSRKMMQIEKRPFICGGAVSDNAELLNSSIPYGFENVQVQSDNSQSGAQLDTEEIEESSHANSSDYLIESLSMKNAFCMFDPSEYWQTHRISTSATLKRVILINLNYNDNCILCSLTREEAIIILTANNNVGVYDENKKWASDSKRLFSMTVPWFDTHSIIHSSAMNAETKILNESMKELMKGDLHFSILNPIIPIRHLAFCTASFLLDGFDSLELIEEPSAVLCAKLRLFRKTLKRHGTDASCLFSSDGTEVNVLGFNSISSPTYYAAFDVAADNKHFVKSYSRGTVADFIAHHSWMSVQKAER